VNREAPGTSRPAARRARIGYLEQLVPDLPKVAPRLVFATLPTPVEPHLLLAGELGAHGIRVVCLRADALPDAATGGSSSREVFRPVAAKAGPSVQEMPAGAAKAALRPPFPTPPGAPNRGRCPPPHTGGARGSEPGGSCG